MQLPTIANDTHFLSEEDFLRESVFLTDDDDEDEDERLDIIDYVYDEEEEQDDSINFGGISARRSPVKKPNSKRGGGGNNGNKGRTNGWRKKSKRTRPTFWCATAVSGSRPGRVTQWSACSPSCTADPRGSFLPAGPRDNSKNGLVRSKKGQKVGYLATVIRRRNAILRRSN